MTLEEILAKIQELAAAIQEVITSETATAEQVTEAEGKMKEIEELEKKRDAILSKNKLQETSAKSAQSAKELLEKSQTKTTVLPNVEVKSETNKSQYFKSNEDAINAAKAMLTFAGVKGYEYKYANTLNNVDGGYLVPEEVATSVNTLVDEYGVYRKYANVVKTSSANYTFLKQYEGGSATFVSEGGAITETSPLAVQKVNLVPKKIAAYARLSAELNDDAMINVADNIVNQLALAYAKKEDQCGFIGDGTSTYGGMVGATYVHRQILEAAGGTWTNDTHKSYLGAAVVAAGNAWSEITAANLDAMLIKIAPWANNGAFFCSKEFLNDVFIRLLDAPSGLIASDRSKALQLSWRGVPIVTTQVMLTAEANSTVPLIYADLKAGAVLCDRSQMVVDTTPDASDFLNDLITIKTKKRFDLVNHDAGNYHATAASRTKGSIVALINTNS